MRKLAAFIGLLGLLALLGFAGLATAHTRHPSVKAATHVRHRRPTHVRHRRDSANRTRQWHGHAIAAATIGNDPVLLGMQSVASTQDEANAGVIRAFSYVAGTSGSTTDVEVYVSRSNKATGLQVGIYSNAAGKPSSRLASGSKSGLRKGAWNDVTVSSTAITAGATYWVALLGSGGNLYFRDGGSALSYGQNASSLPSSWTGAATFASGAASVYVNGTAAGPPPPVGPQNTGAPMISGTSQQGDMLSAATGTWSGDTPMTFTYRWSDGTTGSTDTLTSADVTKMISVTVTATNDGGTASAISASVGPVTASGGGTSCPVAQPQTTWAPIGSGPQMTDAQAAACVQNQPENRTTGGPNGNGNISYNNYVPTALQETAWHSALAVQEHTPEVNAVDGLDGVTNPSTDDLIQWASYKWGIPVDWIRAEAVVETDWRQWDTGDEMTVSDPLDYPPLAQGGGDNVYRSLGLLQISWTTAAADFGVGTEPLRWESTAFNLDFYASVIRWYYDGHCSWCGSGYGAGQQWQSIGAWFEPTPWNNSGAQSYVNEVKADLSSKPWTQPGF
jgi:hypothetical protein